MRYEWIDYIFLIYFCSFDGGRIGAGIPVRGRHPADSAHRLDAQLADRLGAFSLLSRHLSVLQVFYGRNPSFMAGILRKSSDRPSARHAAARPASAPPR